MASYRNNLISINISHLNYRLLKQKQNKKELHDAEFSNVLGPIQQFMCVLYLEIYIFLAL